MMFTVYKVVAKLNFSPLFIPLIYLCMIKKMLFWGQIFKTEILVDLYVLRSPESKNQQFLAVTPVCVSSMTQK